MVYDIRRANALQRMEAEYEQELAARQGGDKHRWAVKATVTMMMMMMVMMMMMMVAAVLLQPPPSVPAVGFVRCCNLVLFPLSRGRGCL